MREHPEVPSGINDTIEYINASEIVLVYCKGCGCDRPMNKNYAKYVNELSGCRFCIDSSNGEW